MKMKLFFPIIFILIQFNLSAQSEKIVVNNLEGFLNAIKSDVTIEITRDLYFDQELADFIGQGDFYKIDTVDNDWNRKHNEKEEYGIIIKNVNNLTIQGKSDEKIKLICDFSMRKILRFDKCKNIEINNIEAGHKIETDCEGFVFEFNNSSDISINNCNLFGSGAVGLVLNDVKYINCNKVKIYDCSQSIIWITDTRSLTFTECLFIKNKKLGWIPFYFSNSSYINFNNCSIQENSISDYYNDKKESGYLFDIDEKSHDITFKNCIIKNNAVNHIAEQKDDIKLINTSLTNNPTRMEKYYKKKK